MSLGIGILGSGGTPAELFVVHGLVAYPGGTFHQPVVAVPNAQTLTMGIVSYSGVTTPLPIMGNAVPHGVVTYSGATTQAPLLDGSFDLNHGSVLYSGGNLLAPSLILGQDVAHGAVTYSGGTLHNPALSGGQSATMGLVSYSGATLHSPSIVADRVRALDAWDTFNSTSDTYTVSAGTDRILVMHVSWENGDNIGTPTYGGQSLTEIYKFDSSATSAMFYLDEAGIVAASGSTFTTDTGSPTAIVVGLGSYEHVDQTSPIRDSATSTNLSGNAPAVDIDTFENGALIAGAMSGTASIFAWTAPLVEEFDEDFGSMTGTVADFLPTSTDTVSVETVASLPSPSRTSVGAVSLNPTLVTPTVSMGLINVTGATLHAPTVASAEQTVTMGLVTYSGGTINNPAVEEGVTAITALDSWSVFGGTDTGTYTVSSGSNRILVMCFTLEATADTVTAPTYGGQTLTEIHNQDVNGGQNAMFYLDEAGIAAAANTTWDATFSTSSGSEIVSIGTYDNVAQSSTVFSTATNINLSGETANFDLTTIDKGLAVAHAYCGSGLNFTWDAPMTEQTDLTNGSAGGSAAHELNQDGSNVSIGADADGNPNRTGVIAACFRPLGG